MVAKVIKWDHIFFLNICHECHKIVVMYVTILSTIYCCALCSYWKQIGGYLISNIRAVFQYINVPPVQNTFRENSYSCSIWRSSRFSDVTYVTVIETITLVGRNVEGFSLVFTLILRVLFNLFDIIFLFRNDKANFWIIFPKKYYFKCHTYQLRMAHKFLANANLYIFKI